MATADLSAARAHELLTYDRTTGVFSWRRTGPGRPMNCSAGTVHRGYRRICINGKKWLAHRIAWLMCFGSFPEGHIDHINGDSTDNRIENLRDVSRSGNIQNQRKAHKNNVTGVLGIHAIKGKFRACLTLSGKTVHLGTHATAKAAHAAYLLAKRELHNGCTI